MNTKQQPPAKSRNNSTSRRRFTAFLLGAAALAPLARKVQAISSSQQAGAADCLLTPAQTEGPFFVEQDRMRENIRAGREGVPLRIALQITRVQSDGERLCAPLPGALVDIWHCDAHGRYSGTGPSAGVQDFLRGQQITGGSGEVRFDTIVPGWYPGRAPHIHFKVRAPGAAGSVLELTSQLYFPPDFIHSVYRREPYVWRSGSPPSNQEDWIFRHGGEELLLALTNVKDGFAARYSVGLRSV